MPQVPIGLFVNHLNIGQGRLATRAPIDEPLGPIKESILPEANKGLPHGPGEPLVHGEALPAPIAGYPQRLELV